MAVNTEQYIVELLLDTTNLESSLAELTKSGQIDKQTADAFKNTTDAIRKQAQEAKKTATAFNPLKKGLDDVAKATKNLGASFTQGVQEGIADALNEAGVSAEEFGAALEQATKSSKSLKAELRETLQAIAQIKLDGGVVPQELIERAGQLKDAMADASAEISNAGSDTRNLDNLLGTAQAVTAGFTVAQGAIGLFGDESEELQKTLLKVNSLMAVLQGLQQIQNALQKEGAITLALANVQRKIQNAQTILNTGAESANVVVKYASVAAQKALNAAMAANPVGILVVAISGLVAGLAAYNSIAADSERQTNELNAALENATTGFEDSAANIRALGEERNKALQAAGAKQSEILKNQNETDKLLAQDRVNARIALEKERDEKLKSSDKSVREQANKLNEALRKLDQDEFNDRIKLRENQVEIERTLIEEGLKAEEQAAQRRVLLAREGSPEQLAAQKAAIQARLAVELNAEGLLAAERTRLQTQAAKEAEQLDVDYRRRRLDAQVKAIENELILAREGTDEEYMLRRRLLTAQTEAELASTKLSEAERINIRRKGNNDIIQIDRQYSEAQRRRAIENEISKNKAVIEQLNANEEDKRELTIQNLSYAAQLEIDAAQGNSDKVKEIIAKRDAEILAVRKQFLEDAAAYELQLASAENGSTKRALEKRAAGEVAVSLRQRTSAIQQLRDLDVAAIDRNLDLVEEEYQQRLISDKEYNLRRAELLDQREAANEASERRITEVTRQANKERVDLVLSTATSVLGIFAQIADAQSSREFADLDQRRRQLEELERVGAITEREAAIRAKRLEAEERAAKRRQAVREKQIAIFDAVLNTAQGVTNAIATGDPYTAALRAAIVGAIGAAQIALIAARPIPQFNAGKTKQNKFQGLGEVAETGHAEILERDGRMYVIKKPTVVDVRKDDVIHSPHETRKIMARQRVEKEVTSYARRNNEPAVIDYDKQAAAFAKHISKLPTTHVNIDRDGFNINVKKGLDEFNYWSKRYRS